MCRNKTMTILCYLWCPSPSLLMSYLYGRTSFHRSGFRWRIDNKLLPNYSKPGENYIILKAHALYTIKNGHKTRTVIAKNLRQRLGTTRGRWVLSVQTGVTKSKGLYTCTYVMVPIHVICSSLFVGTLQINDCSYCWKCRKHLSLQLSHHI